MTDHIQVIRDEYDLIYVIQILHKIIDAYIHLSRKYLMYIYSFIKVLEKILSLYTRMHEDMSIIYIITVNSAAA